MGIKIKILLGFFILASMLFISGAISIFELTMLGKSVKGLVYDNYISIDYSRQMLDALEKQDNALIMLANGNHEKAIVDFHSAKLLFEENLALASKNLTQTNEDLLIDSLSICYSSFLVVSNEYINNRSLPLSDYIALIKPIISATSSLVKNLITINQQGLFKSATFLETSAQRAIIPGLIVIITSIVFTIIFTYLVHHYFVDPIIRLTKGINDYVKYRKPFEVPLETKDELYSLKESIANLITFSKSTVKRD